MEYLTSHIKEATDAQKCHHAALLAHIADTERVSSGLHERISAIDSTLKTRKAYIAGVLATMSVAFVIVQVIVSTVVDLL